MVLDTRKSDFSHMFTSRNTGAIESVTIAPTLPTLVVAPVVKPRKVCKTKQAPSIRHDKHEPITLWYSGYGVTPTRSVAYRTVTVLADFGFAALGTIKYAGETRFVERTSGAWELSQPIAPYI